MSDPHRAHSLTQVFADYLRAQELGEGLDIEDVCAREPDLAPDLKRLHADWVLIRTALESSSTGAPPTPGGEGPAREGLHVGKYRIVRELGRGGMGVVYEAWQTDLQRRVALKLISRELLHSAEHRERFLQEARTAAQVRHPGIVTIYEAGVESDQPYLAMELVQGGSVAERLARGPLPAREAADLVLQVARAVAHLHELGVVHRDVKLQNVLLEADGRPRLTDFGLALVLAARGAHGAEGGEAVAGTPGCMAPEQISPRHGELGPHSDVYALGVLLYVLLTGQSPNPGQSPVERLMATLEQDPRPPQRLRPGLPVDLAAICMRCLERLPARRYPDAGRLADDLERWLRGDDTEAAPPGAHRRLLSWGRRHRALAAHLFAFAVFYALAVFDHYLLQATSREFFLELARILAAWLPLILALEYWSRRAPLASTPRYLWTTVDWLALTWICRVGDGVSSRMLLTYFLLVIASGFWLRTALVAYATALTLVGYVLLAFLARGEEVPRPATFDQHLTVLATLAVAGVLVMYQVRRARILRDYAGRRG